MIARVDQFFLGKTQNPDERLAQLRQFLDGYVIYGDLNTMLACWNDYQNGRGFPFGNGRRLEQPQWVLHDFAVLDAIHEVLNLEGKRPKVDGLPNFEQLFGAPPTA